MNTPAMTVLFTDTEGSTAFTSAHGDERAVAVMHVQERIIRDAAEKYHGRVVKSMGDGFLVVFPTCRGGVAGALDMRERLDAHNRMHTQDTIRVRFGLNFGSVIEEGGDVFGLVVNAAARIAAKALSGQILVPESVRGELANENEWAFVDRGLFWLKGLREQWRLYEVTDDDLTGPAPQLVGRTPFVGRERERSTLREYVSRASVGHGTFVVVGGRTGVGKTRLVEEIGTEAEQTGLHFLGVRCDEVSQSDPYLPFVEILEVARRRISTDQFRVCLGEHAGVIARLLPNLRRVYADIPPAADLPPSEERRYLFTAVQETLAALAAIRPMVVLIDDLHYADARSLLLLEHLATKIGGLPILVGATYTTEDITPTNEMRATLDRLQRRRAVRLFALDDLDEPDVADLLVEIVGSTPPPEVVRALFRATQGNPFFLDEVIRQLGDEGRLLAGGGWDALVDRDVDVPESVRLAIENKLALLRPETRRVLMTMSLLGRDFGFELLEALRELPEDDLVDSLDEAERARLITSAIDGPSVRFAFAHDLIRRTLADDISLTSAQRLHVRLADALEQVHAASLSEHAGAIAHHLESAGRWADRDRTLRFLVMAGERALEAAAYSEALAHFEHASGRLAPDDTARRARVLEGMGTAERSLGHLDEALARWNDALDAMEQQGDALAVARLCLDAAIQVAWWRRADQTMRLVDRGLLALENRPSAYRAGFCALTGQVASQTNHYDEAEAALSEALDVARTHADERMLGLTLWSQTAHHFSYHQYPLCVDEGRESIEHLRNVGDLWNLANVLGYLGASLGWLGRFDEAADVGREGLGLAQRLGNWSAYIFAEQSGTFRDVGRAPDPGVLEERGLYALELGRELGFRWLASVGHARIALAEFWRGRWEEAREHFEMAARSEIRGASGGHLARLFMIHAYLGNDETALKLIDEARPQFPVLGAPNSAAAWGLAAAAVEAFDVLGAADEAAELYDAMVELAATESLMRSYDYRLLDSLLGIAATCARDWDRAEPHFQAAIRRAQELPMRLEDLDAHRFYARMLTARGARGDKDTAHDLVTHAIDGYVALEMPRHVEMARALVN
jgi:class 3 adenylate cyclase/tetratricopeptide (TPR) repeat protein